MLFFFCKRYQVGIKKGGYFLVLLHIWCFALKDVNFAKYLAIRLLSLEMHRNDNAFAISLLLAHKKSMQTQATVTAKDLTEN